MSSGNGEARLAHVLRTQPKTVDALPPDALPCAFCTHQGRIFQTSDQLFSHAQVEHAAILQTIDPNRARSHVLEEALKM
jgi:hypothetical protein